MVLQMLLDYNSHQPKPAQPMVMAQGSGSAKNLWKVGYLLNKKGVEELTLWNVLLLNKINTVDPVLHLWNFHSCLSVCLYYCKMKKATIFYYLGLVQFLRI